MQSVPAAGGKETAVGLVRGDEGVQKLGPDLIGALADRGAYDGGDVGGPGAKGNHGGDCRLQHARQCATPSGMSGPNDAGLRVGEEDRLAIGGQH